MRSPAAYAAAGPPDGRPRVAGAVLSIAVAAVLGPRLVGGGTAGLGGAGVAYAAGPLRAFSDCDAVLGYFKEHAADYLIDQVTRGGRMGADAGGAAEPAISLGGRAQDHARAEASPEHSTTNVQEAAGSSTSPTWVKTKQAASSGPWPAAGYTW